MANGVTLGAGYYKCVVDANASTLKCEKLNTTSGGVHEAFWAVFCKRLVELSEALLKSKHGLTEENQIVATKLDELASNLRYSSFAGGNWLSHIRNIVNYNHRLGVWFPYSGHLSYTKQLFKSHRTWLLESSKINLTMHGDEDLKRFQQTCNFLVAMCRETVLEMTERCPSGNSFHLFGSIAFMNLMRQRLSIR